MKSLQEYDLVSEDTFEQYLSQADNTFIDNVRNYKDKNCYLAKNRKSGFCINNSKVIAHIFSLKVGEGSKAVRKAIQYGGDRLKFFDKSGLKDYYKSFGFKVLLNKNNITYMGLKHKPKMAYSI